MLFIPEGIVNSSVLHVRVPQDDFVSLFFHLSALLPRKQGGISLYIFLSHTPTSQPLNLTDCNSVLAQNDEREKNIARSLSRVK